MRTLRLNAGSAQEWSILYPEAVQKGTLEYDTNLCKLLLNRMLCFSATANKWVLFRVMGRVKAYFKKRRRAIAAALRSFYLYTSHTERQSCGGEISCHRCALCGAHSSKRQDKTCKEVESLPMSRRGWG